MIWSPISVSLPSLLSHQNSRLAELLRAEKTRKEWKEHIARLKEQQGQIVKWEDKDGTSMLTL